MNSNYSPGKVCPKCNEPAEAGLNAKPETVTVCLCCAQVNVFEQDMSLRPINTQELKDIIIKWPGVFGQIVQAISYVQTKKIFGYSRQ